MHAVIFIHGLHVICYLLYILTADNYLVSIFNETALFQPDRICKHVYMTFISQVFYGFLFLLKNLS